MERVERLVADANAIIDLLRADRSDPPQLLDAEHVFLPAPAVGELFAGAHYSARVDENLAQVEAIVAIWTVLNVDLQTARIYGRLRGNPQQQQTTSRLNDLWIAALCIQHELPLLTSDYGFDTISGLRVLHW